MSKKEVGLYGIEKLSYPIHFIFHRYSNNNFIGTHVTIATNTFHESNWSNVSFTKKNKFLFSILVFFFLLVIYGQMFFFFFVTCTGKLSQENENFK